MSQPPAAPPDGPPGADGHPHPDSEQPESGNGERTARRSGSARLYLLPVIWLVLGVAGGAGIVTYVRADQGSTSTASISTNGPATTTPATSAPTTKKPSPSPQTSKPTTKPTTKPTPAATRTLGVVVYNQVGIGGLAARTAGTARAAGWTIIDTGNWRGSVPQDTVYFPSGGQAEAELLADDLDIARVAAAAPGMSTRYLTVILASPR